MRCFRLRTAIVLLVLIVVQQMVCANSAFPAYLRIRNGYWIANSILGLTEGLYLVYTLRPKYPWFLIGIMIPANLASALVGIKIWYDWQLAVIPFLYILIGAPLVSTLIEFPFVIAATWPQRRDWKRSLRWVCSVQFISNTIALFV